MESKWRLNRWLLGLSPSTNALYARYLPSPSFYVTNFGARASNIAVFLQIVLPPPSSPDFGLMVLNFYSGVKPHGGGSPFPYGFSVESDH